MRRAAALLAAGALACTPPELAGSTGTSTGSESTSSSTGEPAVPTGEPDDTGTSIDTSTSTGTSTGDADTTLEPTTDASSTGSGSETGEPACPASDGPGGTLRWSLQGAEFPGQASEIAAHLGDDLVLAGGVDPGTQHADVFVQVRDGDGALRWSDHYAGVHGLEDRVLGLAVDAAGFIHVLIREMVRYEVGQNIHTLDARLVVLRYGPDGAHVWRWERAREPVAEDEQYLPDASIGVAGDKVLVLVMHYHDIEPTALITLDAAGNVDSELPPEEPLLEWRSLGPHGLYFLRDYDKSEFGRMGLDGALHWTAPAPSYMSDRRAFVGPGGALHFVWHDAPGVNFLRHVEPDGTLGPPAPLATSGLYNHVDAGAVRCDGTLLLTGGNFAGPMTDDQLWVGRYTLAAEPLWRTDAPFGAPNSRHEGRRIVAMPDGDALVLAPYFDNEVQFTQLTWLGRFAGG